MFHNWQTAVHDAAARLGVGLCTYRYSERRAVIDLVLRIKSQKNMAMGAVDAYQLYMAARATRNLPGAAAEVGVFEGATARLIREALPGKPLHLCDTFAGMPDAQDGLAKGDFTSPLDKVSAYFRNDADVYCHRGLFPMETGHEVAGVTFSFVHLDVDYYDATLGCLEFFWPRMAPTGIVLTHDFGAIPGATRAFREFFADQGMMIELSGLQALAIKGA
jgi:O-methyltransferase